MSESIINELPLDYLAGFFDGEGCCGVLECFNKKTLYYKPYISFSNTNVNLMKFIKLFLEKYGILMKYHEKKQTKHWKRSCSLTSWNITSALNFCKLIKNKSFIKRKQLELVEEYCESRNKINPRRRAWKRYSEREINIYKELKSLNHRGVNNE